MDEDEDEAGESARGIESHLRINQKREGGSPGWAASPPQGCGTRQKRNGLQPGENRLTEANAEITQPHSLLSSMEWGLTHKLLLIQACGLAWWVHLTSSSHASAHKY